MKLIFNKEGNFVLSQKDVNKYYTDNDDYIVKEVEDLDVDYT